MSDGPEIIRTSLRMNKRLYDKLAEASELHGLTMHAEIIRRLNESVDMDDYVPVENIQHDDPYPVDLDPYEDPTLAFLRDLDDRYKQILDEVRSISAKLAASKGE